MIDVGDGVGVVVAVAVLLVRDCFRGPAVSQVLVKWMRVQLGVLALCSRQVLAFGVILCILQRLPCRFVLGICFLAGGFGVAFFLTAAGSRKTPKSQEYISTPVAPFSDFHKNL